MTEKIIKDFVKGFVKFTEKEQLKRAKEMKGNLEKLNIPTLKWLVNNCSRILIKKLKKEQEKK